MKRRILILEDDPSISRVVRDGLEYNGFTVECLGEGNTAFTAIRSFAPDLVLLDLMLPGLDGYEICRRIAEGPAPIPTIILSARSQSSDKIKALQLGADDYVTKPFVFDELLARIDALLRRTHPVPKAFALGDVQIDLAHSSASKAGKHLDLTHREFELLRFLLIHRDSVVTREQLLRSVWGYDQVPTTRTVDHFIARLRAKIEDDPHHPRFLHTVYGDGYKLTPTG